MKDVDRKEVCLQNKLEVNDLAKMCLSTKWANLPSLMEEEKKNEKTDNFRIVRV